MEDERLDRIERKINRLGMLATVTTGLVGGAIAIAPFLWLAILSDSIGNVPVAALAVAALIVIGIAGALRRYWTPFRD
jgi:hypothetical protein